MTQPMQALHRQDASGETAVALATMERFVSPYPNWVTARGLRQIHDNVRELEQAREQALEAEDVSTVQHIERDLRYWRQRAASALLMSPHQADRSADDQHADRDESPHAMRYPAAAAQVNFGSRVRLKFADGTQRHYILVGEDEAELTQGYVSWTSATGKALLHRYVGESVRLHGETAEILAVEADSPA